MLAHGGGGQLSLLGLVLRYKVTHPGPGIDGLVQVLPFSLVKRRKTAEKMFPAEFKMVLNMELQNTVFLEYPASPVSVQAFRISTFWGRILVGCTSS